MYRCMYDDLVSSFLSKSCACRTCTLLVIKRGCADVVGGLFENKQKDDVTFACKLFEIF
jgi:hypothetical protein